MVSRLISLPATIVVAGLLTSCGHAPIVKITEQDAAGTAVTASPLPPDKAADRSITINAFDDPSRAERITYSTGLRSDPLPTPAPDVKVTQDQALKVAAADSFGSDMQPGTPAIALRQVIVEGGGEALNGPGWILVWKGSAPDIHSPIGISQEKIDAMRASAECLFVYVVDANSGKGVNAQQICRAK